VGGYTRLLDSTGLDSKRTLLGKSWPKECVEIGSTWRDNINSQFNTKPYSFLDTVQPSKVPGRVRGWWKSLERFYDRPIVQIRNLAKPLRALVRICAVSDAACYNIGLLYEIDTDDHFMKYAEALCSVRNDSKSFCVDVPRDKVCVLPKTHTPQRGLTIRSLSHHVCLYEAAEIEVKWYPPLRSHFRPNIINLLLLPWPMKINAGQFNILRDGNRQFGSLPEGFEYFEYHPQSGDATSFREKLTETIKGAKEHVDCIHALIFPELSMTEALFLEAEEIALKESAILIAGAHMKPAHDDHLRNVAAIQPYGVSEIKRELETTKSGHIVPGSTRILQGKHHRWCLDRPQILQYGLGGRIPASKTCWEATPVANRELSFFTFDKWLTWSVLICEDLARQDPVVEALRAVGPNLVIALLMDGPQLRSRWPARYASVLAEDPGSSVLSLTSYGMSARSKPRHGEDDRSRVVGLWRDAHFGDMELELEENAEACVLSLVCHPEEEFTIDGRGDNGHAYYPVFAGLHNIVSKSAQEAT
jgi:hypothetical protein